MDNEGLIISCIILVIVLIAEGISGYFTRKSNNYLLQRTDLNASNIKLLAERFRINSQHLEVESCRIDILHKKIKQLINEEIEEVPEWDMSDTESDKIFDDLELYEKDN